MSESSRARGRIAMMCFAAALVALLVPTRPTGAGESVRSTQILVIHSYHPSFEWTKLIHDGLIRELDECDGVVKLSVEYMDTKRLNTPEFIESLVTLYRAKYRDSPPDVIICSDNNAFRTLYENGDWVFGPGIPLVFCGVNFFDPDEWPGMAGYVGIDERPDLEETVSLIDSLHPDAPLIVFINDKTPTGMAYRKEYEKLLDGRSDSERFVMIDEGTLDELLAEVKSLPEGSVLCYFSFIFSSDSTRYPQEYPLERLADETSFPIYGNYTFMIGHGIIGGPVIDGTLQGEEAARLAIGIVEGRIDPAGRTVVSSPYNYQFDHSRMRRFRIREKQLPAGSIVHGIPEAFWKQYPAETGLVVTVVVVLAAGLAVTFRLLRQRATLLEGIRRLNADLEERVRQRSEALKRAESDLIRSEKLATLGSLVVGIAHEVNSPLGSAITASSFLGDRFRDADSALRRGDLPEGGLEGFIEAGLEITGIVEANLKKAVAQISAFRQVAVDQTGEDPRRFAMSALLGEFLLSMKNELKKARVRVEAKCDEDIVLTHFPGDIWRILANLLMNTLKHAYPDGVEGRVVINIRRVDNAMKILFSDDGVGIPAGLSAQIFDPFYTTARESGGIGLGLHLVRSIIVDRHGGTVGIDTAPGAGLAYRITLPLKSPALRGDENGGGGVPGNA